MSSSWRRLSNSFGGVASGRSILLAKKTRGIVLLANSRWMEDGESDDVLCLDAAALR